jgi:hypothetical protein
MLKKTYLMILTVFICLAVSNLGIGAPCSRVDCPTPDVDKPHSGGGDCWTADPGYENTCSQAASANVIYAECCNCCPMVAQDIYEDLVAATGNVGQYPEEEKASMEDWINTNCPECNTVIKIAHKGYEGQDPVNPENVTFAWADAELAAGEHVKLWIIEITKAPFPPRPTEKRQGSHELTYLGQQGGQAHIHDSDCDIDGTDDDFYTIGNDGTYDYIEDYWGPGSHGYLHGVISTSSQEDCQRVPSLTTLGIIVLVLLLIAGAWMARRKLATA